MPNGWAEAMERIKSTVVFLGTLSNGDEPNLFATASILQISGVFHLLTAKHVVLRRDGARPDLVAFFNGKDGEATYRKLEDMKLQFGVEWVLHPKEDVDLAVMPFPLADDDDLLAIPDELFLDATNLHELDEVFFMSFQPGIEQVGKIRPVYRVGTVSQIEPGGSVLIDGAAFPGNSGSPVFVRPRPTGFGPTPAPVFPAPNSGKFVGVIGSYVPYREAAVSVQTGQVRVIFEENTGLSRVWPIKLITELMQSPAVKEDQGRAKKKARSG